MTTNNVKITFTMEELVEDIAPTHGISYNPMDLNRGEACYIFLRGVWTLAIFISYKTSITDESKFVLCIPATMERSVSNNTWITID